MAEHKGGNRGNRGHSGGDRNDRAPFRANNNSGGDPRGFRSREGRGGFGNREGRPFGDRPRRDGEGGYGDRERKPFGDRPSRESRGGGYGERESRGYTERDRRPYGDRSREDRERGYGDRGRAPFERGERRPFGDREGRAFGDSRSEGGFRDRDRKPFGDRPRRQDDRGYGDRSGAPGERERRPFGDREARPFGDSRREGGYGDRERRPYGDRERSGFGDRDRKPYGDRERTGFGDRDRKPYGDRDRKPFGDRERKPFGEGRRRDAESGFRAGERKQFGDRPSRGPKKYDRPDARAERFSPEAAEQEQRTTNPADLRSSNRPDRERSPEIDPDVTGQELDRITKQQIKTLEPKSAEWVARHLVMAGRLIDEDPELAFRHALAASRRGGRLAAVREAVGLTAYSAGHYGEALREFRTFRRISGSNVHLPVMADCERGLGRPDRALDVVRSPEAQDLDAPGKVELAIVASGARTDLGQLDAAVAELEIPQLDMNMAYSYSPRLFRAYADALEAVGRADEAATWRRQATIAENALGVGEFEEPEIIDLGWDEEEEARESAAREERQRKMPESDEADSAVTPAPAGQAQGGGDIVADDMEIDDVESDYFESDDAESDEDSVEPDVLAEQAAGEPFDDEPSDGEPFDGGPIDDEAEAGRLND